MAKKKIAKKKSIKRSDKKIEDGNLRWDFPSTNHGEDDGFSDPLLEYFQGDHEKYIAREAIQNAIDVRKDYSQPVLVEFERQDMKIEDVPGHKTLSKKIEKCIEFIKGQDKAESFFRIARLMLKARTLSVLRIGDYNTAGLSGADNNRDGGWYRLVKAVGTSSPKGVGGGSFGIGKGAPIAASGIRTVFYSSVNSDGESVFQGKARIVSHYGKGDDVRRGVGFYGINGFQSIRDKKFIPKLFQREKQGTDIYIMGYVTKNLWQEGLIKSVLYNFWLAIYRGDLEVSIIDGKKRMITQENLKELLEEFSPDEALPFYIAVTSPDTHYFTKPCDSLGNVHLFVKKRDDFSSSIMMARKPKMLVQTKHFKTLREPYAAVFLCDDDKGNSALRDTEPPAHDEWNGDLGEDKEKSRAVIKEMESFIKESLRGLGEAIDTEPQDIPGMDRYLPDSDDRDYGLQRNDIILQPSDAVSDEESGRETGAIKELTPLDVDAVMRRSVVVKSPGGGGDGNGGSGGKNKKKGGNISGDKGGEEDKNGNEERIRTADISFRYFVQKSKSGIEYFFVINGKEDCHGAIKLIAVGDDGSYPVDIKAARNIDSKQNYEVAGSFIKGLAVLKGQTVKFGVELASKRKYAIGIENYER